MKSHYAELVREILFIMHNYVLRGTENTSVQHLRTPSN
jgi:hypothetical protein